LQQLQQQQQHQQHHQQQQNQESMSQEELDPDVEGNAMLEGVILPAFDNVGHSRANLRSDELSCIKANGIGRFSNT
jgi:hypothetical protein